MSGHIINGNPRNLQSLTPDTDKARMDAIPNPPDAIIARVAAAMTMGAHKNLSTWDVAVRAIKAQQIAMDDLGFEMRIEPKCTKRLIEDAP